jgi:hypothetical protein
MRCDEGQAHLRVNGGALAWGPRLPAPHRRSRAALRSGAAGLDEEDGLRRRDGSGFSSSGGGAPLGVGRLRRTGREAGRGRRRCRRGAQAAESLSPSYPQGEERSGEERRAPPAAVLVSPLPKMSSPSKRREMDIMKL